jgi:hypothetical protein
MKSRASTCAIETYPFPQACFSSMIMSPANDVRLRHKLHAGCSLVLAMISPSCRDRLLGRTHTVATIDHTERSIVTDNDEPLTFEHVLRVAGKSFLVVVQNMLRQRRR